MADENQKMPADKPEQAKKVIARRVPNPGRSRIAEVVRELAQPLADELGYMLWEVAFVKEGADHILRVTIDSLGEEGITVDDCEKMSHALDPVLDEADPIECSYLLEVESPGIERELTRPEHFDYCEGVKVEVRLFAPVDGSRVFTGILGGMDGEGNITVEVNGTDKVFPRAAVSKVRTVFDF
ncbi:MAG: ribosome maturation factor RimP [Clostridia bacterium]|nr:ribosome maturation factor RimP [Clostridia bacterium]